MDKFAYHSTNFKRDTNTKELLDIILKNVAVGMNRKLQTNEHNQIINFIGKIDPDLLQPRYKNNTINLMSKTLIDEFKKYNGKQDMKYDDSQQIIRDVIGISSESGTSHGIYDNPNFYKNQNNDRNELDEYNSNEMNPNRVSSNTSDKTDNAKLSNLLGIRTSEEMVRVLNPKSLYKKNYFILDSRYRSSDGSNNLSNTIDKYIWDFNLNTQPNDDNSSVNVIGNMRDIVAMRIYPFRIPYSALIDNKYKRISVLIDELSSQAFVAHEKRKFHFMLGTDIDSNFLNLSTDKFNDGHFYFEKPITTLEKISVSFGNPLERVSFNLDRSNYQVDNFSIAPLTKITTYYTNNVDLFPHNLNNGDRVYLSGYSVGSTDPILVDQYQINTTIQSNINNVNGYTITVINNNCFSINLDTSLIQNPLNITFSNVYFGSSRVFIPMEITYIMPQIEKNIE
jgi:hypothetical protein